MAFQIRLLSAALTLFVIQPALAREFVVELKSSAKQSSNLADALGAEEVRPILKKQNLYVAKRNSVERKEYSLEQLRANPIVARVEENILFQLNAVPNDPHYGQQWGLKNLERIDLDIGAENSWDITKGSDQVVVAMIDTGLVADHEDLYENVWVNTKEFEGKEGVDDDGNGYADDVSGWDFYDNTGVITDDHGHGTLCAGLIGARGNNGIGIAGINWRSKLMPLRFAYSDYGGTLANAIAAIDYAVAKDVQIILMPWSSNDDSEFLREAIERAQHKNVLFIVSAGNDGNDLEVNPVYPAAFDNENILTVASLDRTGQLSAYSNYGRKSVDVGAPGTDMVSTSRWDYDLSWEGGTSAAAAFVAGIAALVKSQEPNISFYDLKDRIVYSARKVASLRGKLVSPAMANAHYALINQVAPPDTSDPMGWTLLPRTIETTHPYTNNETTSFQVQVPNAKRFAVLFDQFETEDGYDFVIIKDQAGRELAKLSGNKSGQFSPAVQGDTMTIEFTSDSSSTDFGFLITKIYFEE